jgi:hypothetical protein
MSDTKAEAVSDTESRTEVVSEAAAVVSDTAEAGTMEAAAIVSDTAETGTVVSDMGSGTVVSDTMRVGG